ncbi:MAG TPA: hypothetical protein VIV62_00445 [Chthoniobacterales bacterium]|jgi:hypothetical protein
MDLQDVTEPADFRVSIAWEGAEDKPFYKALLVSASWAMELENLPQFWAGSVITEGELRRIVVAATAHGFTWCEGSSSQQAQGYVVRIQEAQHLAHVEFGFGPQTLQALRAIEAALLPDHRQPIRWIVERIAKTTEKA